MNAYEKSVYQLKILNDVLLTLVQKLLTSKFALIQKEVTVHAMWVSFTENISITLEFGDRFSSYYMKWGCNSVKKLFE